MQVYYLLNSIAEIKEFNWSQYLGENYYKPLPIEGLLPAIRSHPSPHKLLPIYLKPVIWPIFLH